MGIWIGLCNGFLRAGLSSLSHSTGAGLGFELSMSCVDDVGGEGADELDGHVVLRVTLHPKTVLDEIWFCDHWSTHMYVRGPRKAFRATMPLAYPRGVLLSKIYPTL